MYGTATITGNTANEGGGVYTKGEDVFLSGAPQITDNKSNNKNSNLYIIDKTQIKVQNGFTDDAKIGVSVTLGSVPSLVLTSGLAQSDATYEVFSSDNSKRTIVDNGSGEAAFVRIYDIKTSKRGKGTLTADKTTALAGETVTVTATPNEGYALTSLQYNNDALTGNTFIVPSWGADSIYVYAVFSIKTYTVTWQDEDGTVLETDENVEHFSTPSFDGTVPEKEGKTFVGWDNGETVFADDDLPNVTEDVTYTAAYAYDDGIGERLVGHSISLDGDIGVNFYMELRDSIANCDTAYMHFTIPTGSSTSEQKIFVKDARQVKSGAKTYYVFKCQVAAKEMTSQIKAQIINGENLGTEYTYSVKDYAEYLLEHAAEREDWTKAVPLVKAMLNYGAYSQINFDMNSGTLANADLADEEKVLGDVSINIADPITDNLPDGTTFEGATLSLKSETTLSLYFKSDVDLEFSCDGYTVETATSGEYQIARIRGIKAKNIGDIFTLNVSGTTVQYSPLNYCKIVLTPSTATADEAQQQDENLVNVVKARVLYWHAANSYFA